MALDYKSCINCRACESACKAENGILTGRENYRIWVGQKEALGQWPNISIASQTYQPSQCQHCEDAACEKVCPTKATFTDENGIVRVDVEKCILCTYCMTACPYDARYIDARTHTVDKCNLCADTRLVNGETTTACQATCPTKVRTFGDLDDPNSDISKLLETREYKQMKPELGAKPKLFYLV